jgi:hypothetical protein
MFMVHDPIWKSAKFKPRDLVCQPCLEKRIGRKLTMDDYTLCPLNFLEVPGFGTDERFRKIFLESGLDYDEWKEGYLERCERLGLEPMVTFESSQTLLFSR